MEKFCTICGAILPEKRTLELALSWLWFTGYLPETVYFCPRHKFSEKRFELEGLARIKPVPEYRKESV